MEFLFLHCKLGVVSHPFPESVVEDALYSLQIIARVPPRLGLTYFVGHGRLFLPSLEPCEGLR